MRGSAKSLLKIGLSYWPRLSLSVLLGAITIGSSLGLMSLSAYIIAMAALGPSIADLQLAIVGVRFFGISRGVFRYLERLISHETTFRLLARLRVWFYERLEPLAPARLLEYQSSDLITRILSDIETLQQFFLRVLAPPLVALMVTLLAGTLLGHFHTELAWPLILGFLLAGILLPWFTQSLSRNLGREGIQWRASLKTALTEVFQGLADLLASGAHRRHLLRADQIQQSLLGSQKGMLRIQSLGQSLSGLSVQLTIVGLMIVAVPLVNSGGLSGVDLIVIVLAAIASFEAVLPLPSAFQNLETSLTAGERLFEIIHAEPNVKEPEQPLSRPQSFDIRFEHLSFRYEADGPYVLKDLNFQLEEGAFLAVVGPSGAGKSTLINLLMRFWELKEGRILLGNQALNRYRSSDLRSWMAVLSQNAYLFNGTLRENLLLARPEASESEIFEATRLTQLHEFIQHLPHGYETWIGEGGLRLSGGERQRLALARVLLKDAPILILDEPSANLDALTEQAFFDTLHQISQHRTTLLISHRLVTMDRVDQIIVLHQGRKIEEGNHKVLLEARGFYRRMWDLQTQTSVIETVV
jgi:ATP-binding cassette subfamily C protein CydC